MNVFDIAGRHALVIGTGGLGRAVATGLAEHGARVAVADLDAGKADEAAREIGAGAGPAFEVDVTQEPSVAVLAEETIAWAGNLDILVNAFGVTTRKRLEDLTLADWQAVMNVNAQGVFLCCRAFGLQMIRQGGGAIVNLSSVRGRYASDTAQAEYSASKGAVDSLTRSCAAEWARHGVRVNAVAPTVVETELTRTLLENERMVSHLRESIPLGRWGAPEDVVGPVLFLVSPASKFVTGQILYVDGGLTSRI
jgi:NAD(P)-dependent dehydrogenase (short-subunit alcohol dehydrogenase family)